MIVSRAKFLRSTTEQSTPCIYTRGQHLKLSDLNNGFLLGLIDRSIELKLKGKYLYVCSMRILRKYHYAK